MNPFRSTTTLAMVVAMAMTIGRPAAGAGADGAVLRMERSIERPFGLLVGDLVHTEVLLELAPPWRLDEESLGAPGARDYWVDLVDQSVASEQESDRRRYRIRRSYQTFYFNREAKALDVPRDSVRLIGGAEPLLVELPPFEFTTSPLHETAGLRRDEHGFYLRPDAHPALRDAAPHWHRARLFAALALLPLGWLAWRRGWTGRRRPFARAWRAIGSPVRNDARLTALREGMLRLHRALDETAGAPVFAGTLSDFLALRPDLAEVRPLLERFYADSRAVFFGTREQADLATDQRLQALRDLAQRLARLEARS